MTVKLLMTWDIIPGKEQEYFEFVVREFVPGMQGLGIQPTEAWYTVYGESPQILMGIVAEGRQEEQLDGALHSQEWQQLLEELQQYVVDYNQRVVDAAGSFQF